jgi:hypothetical protein
VPQPPVDSVESVIFLIGDVGYADYRRNPVLPRLSADVEWWATRLARDSAVVVLFLGDNVYPLGVHPTDHENFPGDSATMQSQVDVLAGPAARRYHAAGLFLAGNHDWGEARDEAGVRRLRNQERFLDRRREEGINVRLQPEAGEPGPAVYDVGRQVRLLLFDTAWWLLAQDEYRKQRSFQQTEDMIRTTQERHVIVAAHHPFESAGPHSGLIPLWKGLGVRFLLTRSGALQQDLSSVRYRELSDAMLEAFRIRPPLLFAGGHDHNLQVIDHLGQHPWPRYTVVSGSGSKTTSVSHIQGMLYRAAVPGYMVVVTHRSGRVDLFVIAADDDDRLRCKGEGEALAACMAEGIASFDVRYGRRIN